MTVDVNGRFEQEGCGDVVLRDPKWYHRSSPVFKPIASGLFCVAQSRGIVGAAALSGEADDPQIPHTDMPAFHIDRRPHDIITASRVYSTLSRTSLIDGNDRRAAIPRVLFGRLLAAAAPSLQTRLFIKEINPQREQLPSSQEPQSSQVKSNQIGSLLLSCTASTQQY
ncbi:hypothetical protein N7486_011147 [Penicillium sp. IBT 16267x]|nr:hypothetical protein N7486_011147 [Penicillium sp. IBT 16267x]